MTVDSSARKNVIQRHAGFQTWNRDLLDNIPGSPRRDPRRSERAYVTRTDGAGLCRCRCCHVLAGACNMAVCSLAKMNIDCRDMDTWVLIVALRHDIPAY